MADSKPTVGFKDRYANDPEFKRQVDFGRRQAAQKRGTEQLKEALAMTRGLSSSKKKYY